MKYHRIVGNNIAVFAVTILLQFPHCILYPTNTTAFQSDDMGWLPQALVAGWNKRIAKLENLIDLPWNPLRDHYFSLNFLLHDVVQGVYVIVNMLLSLV